MVSPTSFSLVDELARGNTRENRDRLTRWVGRDPDRLAELMELYLRGAWRDAQLAAGVVTLVADEHPDLMAPWLAPMVRRMQERGVHNAVVRTGMHVLQIVDIPRRLAGRVAKVGFGALEDVSQPIAVRVFAMTVLVNLCVGRRPAKERRNAKTLHGGRPSTTVAMKQQSPSRSMGEHMSGPRSDTMAHRRKHEHAAEPALAREVELAITTVLPYGTAAFTSRARRELRRLQRVTGPHPHETVDTLIAPIP